MSWTEYLENRPDKPKYNKGDVVRIINAPWGNAYMDRYLGSIYEIESFYCWSGTKEFYLLEGIQGWIWCEDYLKPMNEHEIKLETDELINLLKE